MTLDWLLDELARCGIVRIHGFGAFWVATRKARRIKSPTGEPMTLPATREVRFRAFAATRRRVNALKPSEKAREGLSLPRHCENDTQGGSDHG